MTGSDGGGMFVGTVQDRGTEVRACTQLFAGQRTRVGELSPRARAPGTALPWARGSTDT